MAVGLVGPEREFCGWSRRSIRAYTRARAIAKAGRRAEAKDEHSIVVVSRRGRICGYVTRDEVHAYAPDRVDLLAHTATRRVDEALQFEAALDYQITISGAHDLDLDLDFERYGLKR